MSNNFNEYNCWDEWDEVDYGDTWDEYDNYTEWDEDDSPDHSDCYGYGVYSECRVEDSYDDSDIPPYVPGKQRLLDIATSHFQVDNYIFTYVIFDKSTNVMIAVTNQEEAFAKVTPVSAVEEINGEYYVDSAASVTFTEMERSIDRLRKKYSAAAEEDIQFISANKGTRVIYKGVYSFTYANQVICNSMAYAPLGATEYRHDYIKLKKKPELDIQLTITHKQKRPLLVQNKVIYIMFLLHRMLFSAMMNDMYTHHLMFKFRNFALYQSGL